MGKKVKLFIVYFPIVLVASQVLVNILSFVKPSWYSGGAFYLNTFFGTNVFFAIFLFLFTIQFKFCEVSRWASFAELLFAINYMVVQQDNLYNILFQVIAGTIALFLTGGHYANKFPLCKFGLFWKFIKSWFRSNGNCKKGIERWDGDIETIILKRKHET